MQPQLNHIIAQQRVSELRRLAANQHAEVQLAPQRRNVRVRSVKRITSLLARFSTARA
jgi:hypothetical protein